MRWRKTLRERVKAWIAERRDDAFLTREFFDLGGEGQVLRALRELTEAGDLIRLGYGVYARAELSSLTKRPMLASDGFEAVACHVLDKLGVAWEQTKFQRAYNEGRSTQVPVNAAVRVKGRFARRLSYQDRELIVER